MFDLGATAGEASTPAPGRSLTRGRDHRSGSPGMAGGASGGGACKRAFDACRRPSFFDGAQSRGARPHQGRLGGVRPWRHRPRGGRNRTPRSHRDGDRCGYLGVWGPRASIPPASTPPASTIDLSLGSGLVLDPGALEPGDDGIGLDQDTSSESDVKLNLAKAYIELGDAEGARAILQEVSREGTSAERDEAAQLLAQIA